MAVFLVFSREKNYLFFNSSKYSNNERKVMLTLVTSFNERKVMLTLVKSFNSNLQLDVRFGSWNLIHEPRPFRVINVTKATTLTTITAGCVSPVILTPIIATLSDIVGSPAQSAIDGIRD